jgi:hypothetical protein
MAKVTDVYKHGSLLNYGINICLINLCDIVPGAYVIKHFEALINLAPYLTLPANIRVGWEGLQGTNTLAY